jgi:hypothetical protein
VKRDKLYKLFERDGHIRVAVNDPFMYQRRNELNLMVQEGLCDIHFLTPSYNSYTLKEKIL